MRGIEEENSLLKEDIQHLLSRVEEAERENTDLRITGEQKLDEEKRKLLEEVEEIRKKEELMEREISDKIEGEIMRM
jgi:hypothetical protein